MEPKLQWRKRATAALHSYFRRRSWPRAILSLVLILTGGAGFATSYFLLKLGLDDMWMRYPFALLVAYAVLLALIRLWVEIERQRFDANPEHLLVDETSEEAPIAKAPAPRPRLTSLSKRPGRWVDWVDIDWIEFDEGCLPMILLVALVGIVIVLVVAISEAPLLLAEVFLDAFLVSVLYRRLKIAADEHWLATAINKTWGKALFTAFLLALIGICLERLAPGARSIGPAIHQILTGNAP